MIGAYELTAWVLARGQRIVFLQATVPLLIPLFRNRTNGQMICLAHRQITLGPANQAISISFVALLQRTKLQERF